MTGDGRIPLYILGDEDTPAPELAQRQNESACLSFGVERQGMWSVYRRVAPTAGDERKHGAFCSCCAGRGDLATALNLLFLDRVRGACPPFSFVVVSCEACRVTDIRELLQQDAIVRARYQF